MNSEYKVLGPWAEADPVPLKGISPRLSDLNGKKIGLYANPKERAIPILTALSTKLKARFPESSISIYHGKQCHCRSVNREQVQIRRWIKSNDAFVTAFGD